MSDTTPNDGKTIPDTDAPPTPPTGATDRAAAQVPDAPDAPQRDTRSAEATAHAAAVAAATERANSSSLAGEYTDAEAPTSDAPMSAVRADDAANADAPAPDPADAPYVPGAAYVAATETTAAPSSAVPSSPAPSSPAPSSGALTADYAAPPVVAAASSASDPVAPATQTPIYVQAPTPPKPRGNRGAGVLIALLATLVYAGIYAVVAFIIAGVTSATVETATATFVEFAVRPVFYVPIIFFFLAFSLLIILVNRAGWWSYVLFGFLVAVVVYFSYLGGALLTVQAWSLTPEAAVRFLSSQWLNPGAIAAAVIAREVPIWFGAWISRRGRGVTARNLAARTEYERVLAEGPQLARSN